MRGALAALLAAGCVSAPPDRHFADYAPIPPGQARLYVYRPETSTSTPRAGVSVSIDGRPLTLLARDEFATVALPPGEHRVTANRTARPVELAADRATFCRILATSTGGVLLWDIRCGASQEANAALRECSAAPLDRSVDWEQ